MKKIFMILILILTLTFVNGCIKDSDRDDGSQDSNIDLEVDKDKENKDKDEDRDEKENDKSQETDIDQESNADKTEDLEEEISEEKPIEYKDEKYGFTLELPASWEGYYTVNHEEWFDEASESISFNFESGNIYSNIFNIIVIEETIKEEDWEDPFQIYIREEDGKTYSYIQAMEPPQELLEDENDIYLTIISKMVGDVPTIIESFKLNK